MIVQVTGDRNWRDAKIINNVLFEIQYASAIKNKTSYLDEANKMILRTGDAIGADIIADACAQVLGWPEPERYPAEWKRYGPSAGPKRNQLMVDLEPKADLAIGFHDDLGKSKGTKDMLMRCLNNDIKSFHFNLRDNTLAFNDLRSYVEGL